MAAKAESGEPQVVEQEQEHAVAIEVPEVAAEISDNVQAETRCAAKDQEHQDNGASSDEMEAFTEDGATNKRLIITRMQDAAGKVRNLIGMARETVANSDQLRQLESRATQQGWMYMDMMKGMDAHQYTYAGSSELGKLISRWHEELAADIVDLVDNSSFNPAANAAHVDSG